MNDRPVGIAVIGCGSTAHRRHLPVWRDLPGARLVAVVSRDPTRRQEAAAQYGALRALADWRELLTDASVEAVDVCTPHPQHGEIAIALAAAGKHVLCEKPLATDLPVAMAMVEAAKAAGVVLMPFLNMRLLGASATAIALVRQGAIGEPQILRGVMAHGGPDRTDIRREWFWQASSGGGAILDLGPHIFDLAAQIMPAPASRIRATLRQPPGMAVESDGFVEIEYNDGSIAHMSLSWSLVAARESSLTVHGTTGSLRIQLLLAPDPAPNAPAAPLVLSSRRPGDPAVSYPTPATSTEPCSIFLQAVRGGDVSLSADAGLEVMRYISGCYRSHQHGSAWVSVK